MVLPEKVVAQSDFTIQNVTFESQNVSLTGSILIPKKIDRMRKTTILIFVTSLILVSCGDNRTSQTGNNAENVQDNPVKIDKIINIADISNKSIKEVNKLLGANTG